MSSSLTDVSIKRQLIIHVRLLHNEAYELGEAVKEAFILFEPDADRAANRFTMDGTRIPTLLVPVPDDTAAARIAGELADDGVGLIKRYGGLST